MENTRDRLIRYIQDAHEAEVGIAEILDDLVDASSPADGTRPLFEEHLAVTRNQIGRLEQRLHELGAEPSGGKGFVNALMSKFSGLVGGGHDGYDAPTQNLIKAYAIEHLEQGMYASLISYAESYGDEETAILADELMAEEEEAALKIFPMIEACAQRAFDAARTAPEL